MKTLTLHNELIDSMITEHVDIAKKEMSKIDCAKLTEAIDFLIDNDIRGLELSHTFHVARTGATVNIRDSYGVILDMYQKDKSISIVRRINIPRIIGTIEKVLDVKANKEQYDIVVKMIKSKDILRDLGIHID